MSDDYRVIESEKIKAKLIDGTEIFIRPLTLAERKKCISLLPENFKEKDVENFLDLYMKAQGDILFYIITRINKDFKREDIDTQLDSSLVTQIISFTLKDPFSELM